MQNENHKEVERARNGVGSTSKPIKAMDACWKWGYAFMIPWKLRQGYGCSLAAKQCQEKRDKEHKSNYK